MELRLPLEVSPGREATCRAVFGTWGSFPDDARAGHCPFVLASFTGWSSERCPGIGEVSEPLVGRQGSRVSMRMARGSASLLSSHGRVPGTSPGCSRVFEGETA